MAHELDRPIPKPTGTVVDTTQVRQVMIPRIRETQPQINQPYQNTIPGKGSGDQ